MVFSYGCHNAAGLLPWLLEPLRVSVPSKTHRNSVVFFQSDLENQTASLPLFYSFQYLFTETVQKFYPVLRGGDIDVTS